MIYIYIIKKVIKVVLIMYTVNKFVIFLRILHTHATHFIHTHTILKTIEMIKSCIKICDGHTHSKIYT